MRIAGLLLILSLTLSGLSLLARPLPASADDGPEGAIRAVIGSQIEAFRVDDGSTAYSFAAPELQRIFPTADVFMSMVRSGYQPVYRPRSIAYGRLKVLNGAYVQEVFVVGPDGDTYTALYALKQQPDGSWKISGCSIVKTPSNSA